jgi:threonine dehydrogenase-like Zn-dependent dehydrogenase
MTRVGGDTVELVAPRRLELRRLRRPEPGPGEAVVRTRSVGICGTDLHAYGGRQDRLPIVLGHDMAGVVETTGDATDRSWLGKRVTVDPTVACGECEYCRADRPALCSRGGYMGMTTPGALAEYVAVPCAQLVELPESVTDESATVVEPVVVALGLLERARPLLPEPGPAAVVGGGPLGLLLARVLEYFGHAVTVFEPVAKRRELGAGMGLHVLPPGPADLGAGPRLVVETSASQKGVALVLELATPGSVIGVIGRAPAPVSFADVLLRELAVLGVRGGPGHYPEAVRLIATGAVDPCAVITHRFPMSEAPAAFAHAHDPANGVVRAVLERELQDAGQTDGGRL